MRIEDYTPRWQGAVIELADRIFGVGYFARPSEIALEPDALFLISREGDNDLLGFVQGRLLAGGDLRGFLEHRVADVPDDIDEADSKGALGVIQAVAVAPEQRRQGVGSKLLLALHDALVGHGADKLIVTFKRGGSAAEVGGVMNKLGFEFWMKLPSYWQARCESGEFRCIDRRNGCTCDAVFYRKAVY